MAWYKDGARPNPAMRSVAGSLDDQQTEALALYFASLPKPATKK
jgi:cytochrome c553